MSAPGGETTAGALAALLTPEAVRERAHDLLRIGLDDGLPHFRIDLDRLPAAVELVAAETRAGYPDLAVPPHSRWRHFELHGRDLWDELRLAHPALSGAALARARFDLAVVSVLLDAGAGAQWRYRDTATATDYARSEGLAVASLRMFAAGAFSSDASEPLRADAAGLAALDASALAHAFQAGDDNPLLGLDGRAALLNRLGNALCERGGSGARPAMMFDALAGAASGDGLPAREILIVVLDHCNAIWPAGLAIDGMALGDVGRHSALRRADRSNGLVPLHKLSQWLSYSLVEPLVDCGIAVRELDGLTGLAEYRNGGLFLDTGVLAPRDPGLAAAPLAPGHEAVVEWRALTVALLDRLAEGVRAAFGRDSDSLPLAAILQGGSWAAGRRLAGERRDGLPPLAIVSDGTVF